MGDFFRSGPIILFVGFLLSTAIGGAGSRRPRGMIGQACPGKNRRPAGKYDFP